MGTEIGIGVLLLGGVGALLLFLLGYLSAGRPDSTLTIGSGGSGGTPTCDTLCATWNGLRATACAAVTVSAAAASGLAAANAALAGAVTTAAVLLAAAVAASLIPFIGPVIAGPLFGAYAVAQAAMIVLLGRQVAAAQTAAEAASGATGALAAASRARAALMAGCTDATALADCLAMRSPCAAVP